MVNTAIDAYRQAKKQQKRVDMSSVSDVVGVEDFTIESLSAEDLLSIIQTIPNRYRVVFNLFAIEGYSYREIAKQLNMKENTCKSNYLRAKKILRMRLVEENIVQKSEG